MPRKRKRQALVSQYLEHVSRNALEEYQDVIREFVRRRHGIYALYRNDKLYYVGLASNLRNRLKAHLKNRHGESWDRFSVYSLYEPQEMLEEHKRYFRKILHGFIERYPFNPALSPSQPTSGTR